MIFFLLCNEKNHSYVIPKDSIAPNYSSHEFKISGGHLIRNHVHWICPEHYFEQDKSQDDIEYYHIELPNYITDHLVINGGIIVESYMGNTFPSIYKQENQNRLNCHRIKI